MAVEDPDVLERVARSFHDTYEELAPQYGYQTRPESATDWENVPPSNRMLMIGTIQRLVSQGVITIPQGASPLEQARAVLSRYEPWDVVDEGAVRIARAALDTADARVQLASRELAEEAPGADHVGSLAAQRLVEAAGDAAKRAVANTIGDVDDEEETIAKRVREDMLLATGLVRDDGGTERVEHAPPGEQTT